MNERWRDRAVGREKTLVLRRGGSGRVAPGTVVDTGTNCDDLPLWKVAG